MNRESRLPRNYRLALVLLVGILVFIVYIVTNRQTTNGKELIEADKAFSDLSAKEGRNHSFLQFCAEDAVLLRPGSRPVEGRDKIRELLSKPDSAYTLTWKADYGYIAKSGEHGYTYGTWESTIKATGGKSRGTYVTVWRKDKEDNWKWVLDAGNEGLGE
jgi:ketosteroid isomerase-like protein